MGKSVPLLVAALLAIISLVLTFTRLPGGMDTEPILAVAVLLVALTGLRAERSSKS